VGLEGSPRLRDGAFVLSVAVRGRVGVTVRVSVSVAGGHIVVTLGSAKFKARAMPGGQSQGQGCGGLELGEVLVARPPCQRAGGSSA